LGFNHYSLIKVHAARGHGRSHLFKGWVIVFLAVANTTKHCEKFFE
jgi:hypothetical protein